MVIGVRDSDLAIVGINPLNKEYDRLLLRIDSIWHSQCITNQSGRPLPQNTFTTKLVVNGDKTLLVICITAPREGGIFETDGVVWHRLNASNYAERSESTLQLAKHAAELDALRRLRDQEMSHRAKLTQDYRAMVSAAQEVECELRAEIKRLKDAAATRELFALEMLAEIKRLKDAAEIRDLFASILAQKTEAESQLASKPVSSLFCGLW